MHILKSLMIAFSIYSKIPVPQFEWKDEDMKYMLCFFPWIGAVIGICLFGWSRLCDCIGVGEICRILIGGAIPLIITGGFHADGFMDTMDAFHSYRTKEEKLEILKDPHIGAFSVIMLAVYGMLYLGAFSEVTDTALLKLVCAGFFLSRCLSGLSVVSFPQAKEGGMLFLFADSAGRKAVKWTLCFQGLACIAYMVLQAPRAGILVASAALVAFLGYYRRTKKELGGITGDTAGWFVLLSEGAMMLVAAIINQMI